MASTARDGIQKIIMTIDLGWVKDGNQGSFVDFFFNVFSMLLLFLLAEGSHDFFSFVYRTC